MEIVNETFRGAERVARGMQLRNRPSVDAIQRLMLELCPSW
ncbi:MAG: hypothetical protein QXK94_07975 [Candidatus Jordarchaeales archaeon]